VPRPVRYYPEDWSTMRAALVAWLKAEATLAGCGFAWREQRGPSPAKPYVSAGVLVPSVPEGQPSKATCLAVRVATVTPGATYSVEVGGETATYVAGLTPTAATIRDGLVEALIDELGEGAALGAYPDALELAYALNPPLVLSDGLEPRVSAHAIGDGITTISVDVYADVDEAGGDLEPTVPISSALAMSLDKPGVHEALAFAGWAPLSVVGTRRFGLATGGGWESRAGFDLRLRSRRRTRELAYWLQYFDATSFTGSLSA
jgi:hypothetical protein